MVFSVVLLFLVALCVAWLSYIAVMAKRHNHIDWGGKLYNFLDGLFRFYCYRFHGLADDKIDLPKQGGAIVVSNHVSGIDPLILIACCDRPLRFMIAKEEYERFGLKWLFKGAGCIPVDRKGRADIAFRQAKRALDNGEVLALFPHGKIHLDHEQPYRVKPGIKRLAELSGSDIYLSRITGVRGQGSVFAPIFLRSQSHIQQFPSINQEFFERSDALLELGELLLGHRQSLE
ncbi:MAG: 1-acyl-sn-glycerol-3-phosphate acyltransferase [Kangiellaceae bacterium]|nr:1-acyl-sn-glycerol-3-phosphate acyltransferase [Kangiellaceae bacterium]